MAAEVDETRPEFAEEAPPDVDSLDWEKARKIHVPEYDLAIKRGSASLSQVAEAWYQRQPGTSHDEVHRLVMLRYLPLLFDAFEKAHGGIRQSYWCGNIQAVAVVSETNEYHTVNPIGISAQAEALLFASDKINTAAQRTLRGPKGQSRPELGICVNRLYSITTHLLEILDNRRDKEREVDKRIETASLELLKSEVTQLEAFATTSAQRNARLAYFGGMLWGMASLTLGAVLAGSLLVSFVGIPVLAISTLLAGGTGALVSVMSRMHGGRLLLNSEAGPRFIRLLGGFRPFIGAIMALVIYILIVSGLLPVSIPNVATVEPFFFAGIGFLAGFSERWAQDMLVQARSRLGGGAEEEE